MSNPQRISRSWCVAHESPRRQSGLSNFNINARCVVFSLSNENNGYNLWDMASRVFIPEMATRRTSSISSLDLYLFLMQGIVENVFSSRYFGIGTSKAGHDYCRFSFSTEIWNSARFTISNAILNSLTLIWKILLQLALMQDDRYLTICYSEV